MDDHYRYHVMPRYTSGSPAHVSYAIACQVADNERRAYELARQGIGSPETVAAAQQPHPLANIVVRKIRDEQRGQQCGAVYEDLILREERWEPYRLPDGPVTCANGEHVMDMRTVHFSAAGPHVAVEGLCLHCQRLGRAVLTTAWEDE